MNYCFNSVTICAQEKSTPDEVLGHHFQLPFCFDRVFRGIVIQQLRLENYKSTHITLKTRGLGLCQSVNMKACSNLEKLGNGRQKVVAKKIDKNKLEKIASSQLPVPITRFNVILQVIDFLII